MMCRSVSASLALWVALAAPALAQSASPAGDPKSAARCAQGADTGPATKPTPDNPDSTAPGNAGSTGWSGGTGGSNVGTSQNGSSDRAAAQPATKPAPASQDGTAPGNSGSTGWSGGTGGSNIGTSQNGSVSGQRAYQPATAKGLDPIASKPIPAAARC